MFDEKSYSLKMDKAIEVFSKELTSLRTGRANAAMLDLVKVDVYGQQMPINQVGSITETLETMNLGKKNNYTSMVSHRSGETEDTYISHLVTGTSSGQIKTGAPARSEMAAKYNELLRIGEKVGYETFNNKKWKT